VKRNFMTELHDSNTAPISRSQILFILLEYLQETKKEGNLDEDALESIDVASQCLSSAFKLDISSEEQKKLYSLKPQNLEQILSLGLSGKQRIAEALELLRQKQLENPSCDDVEQKFAQYVQVLKQKGFFDGLSIGSPEYEQRFMRARQKFMEKYQIDLEKERKGHSQTPPTASLDPSLSPVLSTATSEEKDLHTSKTNSSVSSLSESIDLAEKFKMEGNQCLSLKEFQKAIENYSKAIELNSSNAIYFSNRAAAYSHIGMHENAIEDCLAAIRIDPSYSKPYGRLGLAFFNIGKYKEAVEYYRQALLLEPNNANLKSSLNTAERKLMEQQQQQQTTSSNVESSASASNPANFLNNPNIMNAFGSMFGSTAASDVNEGSNYSHTNGSGFNFASIMNNPMFQSVAQQIMNNPEMMNMANDLIANPQALNSMLSTFGVNANDIAGSSNQQQQQQQQQQQP